MPEFILDTGPREASARFKALDSFTQGYIEAMFFAEEGPDEGKLGDAHVGELAEEAWSSITTTCTAFQLYAHDLLEQAYERGYEEEQAGRDYWFTRNGHGVGFLDRDELEADDLGKRLSAKCGWHTPFPEVYICRGNDDLIYHD